MIEKNWFNAFVINPDFSLEQCTYSDTERSVIFSPFTLETLLCKPAVVDFLQSLVCSNENLFCAALSEQEVTKMTEKLTAMKIILIQE